jgi:hypothetical protein
MSLTLRQASKVNTRKLPTPAVQVSNGDPGGASKKVFGTTELLVEILALLDTKALLRSQQVCQVWNAVITATCNLQKKLFFKAETDFDEAERLHMLSSQSPLKVHRDEDVLRLDIPPPLLDSMTLNKVDKPYIDGILYPSSEAVLPGSICISISPEKDSRQLGKHALISAFHRIQHLSPPNSGPQPRQL